MPLTDPNRLFPVDKRQRDLARALYDSVAELPIISPHFERGAHQKVPLVPNEVKRKLRGAVLWEILRIVKAYLFDFPPTTAVWTTHIDNKFNIHENGSIADHHAKKRRGGVSSMQANRIRYDHQFTRPTSPNDHSGRRYGGC